MLRLPSKPLAKAFTSRLCFPQLTRVPECTLHRARLATLKDINSHSNTPRPSSSSKLFLVAHPRIYTSIFANNSFSIKTSLPGNLKDMSKRKADDSTGEDDGNNKRALIANTRDRMRNHTAARDPTLQRLPNEVLEQICQYTIPDLPHRTLTLGAPSIVVPEDIILRGFFATGHLPGISAASRTTRRMVGTAALHQTTFTSRIDLSTPARSGILPLLQLQNMPHIIRANVRSIKILVQLSGTATFHGVEQWARIWYESALLRKRASVRSREVEVDYHVNWGNGNGLGFLDANANVFWIDGDENAGEFLDLVRHEAEVLVAEEKVKAAEDSNFVVGQDIAALRQKLRRLLMTPHCDQHLEDEDWSWKCGKCMLHELIEGWRMAAGLGGQVHGAN